MSPKLAEAFAFAREIHADQFRKGARVPFITHPMAVAALVGEDGGSETEIIAALLHDCVEDGDGMKTLDAIRAAFGGEVAGIVEGCTDAYERPKPPWRARKEAFVASLRDASPSVKRVVTADKIHNVRALRDLLKERGAEAWDAFKGGRDGTLWYYHAIVDALENGYAARSLEVLKDEVHALQELADAN
jgi:(p)ppGpp synthase/HD superfamily hydrolase